MQPTSCHFPITVRIAGTLGDEQLDALAAHVERAVTERIAAAERDLARLPGDRRAAAAQPAGTVTASSDAHLAARPGPHRRHRAPAKRVRPPATIRKPREKAHPSVKARQPGVKSPSGETVTSAQTLVSDAMAWLLEIQAEFGEHVLGAALGQPLPPHQPALAAESIGQALAEVGLVSSRTRKVRSLRPWVIFETLPWNPLDGGKKRLFAGLQRAYAALRRAEGVLADAQQREAALASAPAHGAHQRAPKAAKKPPTVAQAQAAVTSAESRVTDATRQLKQYVKSKLATRGNPRTAAARAELSAASQQGSGIERQLKAARRGKKHDPDEVARLTALLATARGRESAAAEKLAGLLQTLRTEIDEADWSPQEIDKTVAVYEVDGTRATLEQQVEAYATVTAEGFEASARRIAATGPTVPELLAKDTTLGVSSKQILSIISRFEGGFTAVNTWDIADVTFGMVQWTTGASGKGDLTQAMSIIKRAAPEAFAARLVRYGIDVDPRAGLVLTRPDGTVLRGVEAAKTIQTDAKLVAVLSAAGSDPAIQAAELRAANDIEIKGALNAKLQVSFPAPAGATAATTVAVPVSALITSEYGVGVLANRTVHGGFPGKDLKKAINEYVASHHIQPAANLADWGPHAEDALVKAISDPIDADRIDVIDKQLDHKTGSFR
jgi:hypothetical protein